MKRLYIIVEGQTEQEFVKTLIAPYLQKHEIFEVTPILIRTSKTGRGGFVNYQHLKKDAERLLKSEKKDFIVSMFVDFFRCPEVPHKEKWSVKSSHIGQVEEMERCIKDDIKDVRFIPMKDLIHSLMKYKKRKSNKSSILMIIRKILIQPRKVHLPNGY